MNPSPDARQPAAGVIVTGTEVLTGLIQDANGPWLSVELRSAGFDVQHITICRDRPQDIKSQLAFMAEQGIDLIVTTGGLGPTADDLTADVVSEFCGREMHLDEAIFARIEEILKPLAARFPRIDHAAVEAANRKQARVPAEAEVIAPAGTAPGFVVTPASGEGPVVMVLPGPPRELQQMWRQALATDPVRPLIERAVVLDERMMRLVGIPESEIAETLRLFEREHDLSRLEVTTCMREGELEVATSYDAGDAPLYEALKAFFAKRHARELFSPEGATVDQLMIKALAGRKVATAESCTGGMLAERLTQEGGASEFFAGGVVSYSNEAKRDLLGVSESLLKQHGAVSGPVAEAMADGALDRFDAQFAVSITGVAGPGGGTEEKPVGFVWFCAVAADSRRLTREVQLFGRRKDVRERSTVIAMHLVRRLAQGDPGDA